MVRDGRFETANPVQAALKNSQPIRCPPGDVPIKCVRVHSIHMPTAQCCERLMRQISVYPPVNIIRSFFAVRSKRINVHTGRVAFPRIAVLVRGIPRIHRYAVHQLRPIKGFGARRRRADQRLQSLALIRHLIVTRFVQF